MKCDNCRAYNAHVIIINEGEKKQLLCPRCLKILKEMDKEYEDIVKNVQKHEVTTICTTKSA